MVTHGPAPIASRTAAGAGVGATRPARGPACRSRTASGANARARSRFEPAPAVVRARRAGPMPTRCGGRRRTRRRVRHGCRGPRAVARPTAVVPDRCSATRRVDHVEGPEPPTLRKSHALANRRVVLGLIGRGRLASRKHRTRFAPAASSRPRASSSASGLLLSPIDVTYSR